MESQASEINHGLNTVAGRIRIHDKTGEEKIAIGPPAK